MEERIAIIDIGTNSTRLVLMNLASDRSYKLIDELRETLRLGEYLSDDGWLTPAGIERVMETARVFARYCKAQRADRTVMVGTSALRSAHNGPWIADQVFQETGLRLNIISGDQEAYYDYVGAFNTLGLPNGLLLDVGGGSAEVVNVKDRQPVEMVSLPLGAITLKKHFLDPDKNSKEQLRLLDRHIQRSYRDVAWLEPSVFHQANRSIDGTMRETSMVGVGGTIRNIAKIYKRRVEYPLDLLHGLAIPADALGEIYHEVRSLPLAQRKLTPGLSPARADIIVGGMAAVHGLARLLDLKEIVISGRGLREGLFLSEIVLKGQQEPAFEDPALYATNNLMRYYGVREDHADHVADLALSLFDGLAPLHGLEPSDRRLLRIAALLHDVGIALSYYDHGEHGFYLLTHTGIDGLTHRELVIVAYIVAAHSGSGSQLKRWTDYRALLQPEDSERMARLGAILRLCELLDRSESGIIESLQCRLSSDGSPVQILARTVPDGEFELRQAQGTLPDLEKALGIRLSLQSVS